LIDRTEGWPALLSLVRTNIAGHDPMVVRQFVHELSGAAGDVYEYLAEEVVDRLPDAVTDFLTKASVLDEIDEEAARVVVHAETEEVTRWLLEAETYSLVSRPDRNRWRISPLVMSTSPLPPESGPKWCAELHCPARHRLTRWRQP
jgi:LuxR family maltose regulon positive regulatory protein